MINLQRTGFLLAGIGLRAKTPEENGWGRFDARLSEQYRESRRIDEGR